MNRALTGIRPTGDLTIANYVGAMRPLVEMQETFDGDVNAFVADVHGLTDQEPAVVTGSRLDTVRAYLAAGIDPQRTTMYLQSQIGPETMELAWYLGRHTTVAELSRVSTLKDKLGDDETADSATLALFGYPVLMAADIAMQDATHVPVGQDQIPHIELTRRVVRRFNKQYGSEGASVLVEPEILATQAIRIMALNGRGKMSKSNPNGAISLQEMPADVDRKIKRAQAASPGETTPVLDSHFTLAEALCRAPAQLADLAALKKAHFEGGKVMVDFKRFLADRINGFLGPFQERYASYSDHDVKAILREGGEQSQNQARVVLDRTKQAMGFISLR